ncbi:MAG: HAD-IB family hydrolase [Candidatus Paceibacterota bacterium]
MKPLAISDIDGTIFRSSLVIELNRALVKYGVFPPIVEKEIEHHYIKWVNRKGDYDDYINQVIKAFDKRIEGCSVEDIKRVSEVVIKEQKDKVYRFTRDLIKEIKKKYVLVAISGSPIEIVKIFARKWGFEVFYGTFHYSKNGRYTGEINVPARNKEKVVLDLKNKTGWSLKNSIGVGDTETDIGFLKLVSKPICFNPNKKLYNIAKKNDWKIVVERKDMVYKI